MADRKISDLTPLTAPAAGDYLPIVDISEAAASSKNKRITIEELMRGAPDGTAGAPGFAFESDPNSGIYSPGADQVAISTGGTGRLFVDASGNISAGNSTAFGPLDIKTSAGKRIVYTSLADYASNGIIGLTDGGNETDLGIGGNNLRFFTAAIERLRITSAGLVGVGTSSVTSLLTIKQDITAATAITQANSQISIESGSSSGTDLRSTLYFAPLNSSGNGSPAAISAIASGNTNSSLAFYTNGASNFTGTPVERLRIDDQGRVGIGTNATAPDTTLYVRNTTAFDAQIKAVQTDSTGGVCAIKAESNSAQIDLMAGGSTYAANYMGADEAGLITQVAGDSMRFNIGGSYCRWTFGASEAARIDSSGRLLVGASSARSNFFNSAGLGPALQLESTSSEGRLASIVFNTNSASGPYLILGKTRATSNGASTLVNNGDEVGALSFQAGDGTDLVEAALIKAEIDGTPGANDMPGRLVFSTTADGASSPTERMRIDNAGRIGVNGTNSTQQFAITHNGIDGLAITDTNGSSAQTNLLFSNTRAGGTTNYYILGYANAVNTFIVYSNGNVQNANNSYGAISDLKLKENIVNANSQWSDIKALQVRNYNFKEGQTHTQIGLIAQEVELVSPGLITESPDRDAEGNDLGTVTKSVNYSVLYMKAVKALQEAMERIELLEARLDAANL